MKKQSRTSYGKDLTAMYCKDAKGYTLKVGDSVCTHGGATGYKINRIIFSDGEPMLELARLSYRLAKTCRLGSATNWVR